MFLLFTTIGWFAIVAGLLFRAVQQFRGYDSIRAEKRLLEDLPSLTVIVPARNEAERIGDCLEGLLGQDYPSEQLTMIVVDDKSTDGTSVVVREAAGSNHRLELVVGEPLPEGWMGKPHACWQGARTSRGEWLCFVDADTRAAPALLRTAVVTARQRELDMLSLEPYQVLGSFWERLVIPCGFFLMAFFQDLRRVNDPRQPDAVANGQFILIRREVYQSVGGHAAVRREITEDTALARLVKASGGRLAVLGAEDLIRTRMYTGLAPLWEGITKNVIIMAGGIPRTLLVAFSALLLAAASILLPAWTGVALALGDGGALTGAACALAWSASLAMFATHVAGTWHFRIPAWYGLLFPLGYSVGAAIACHSVHKWLRGNVSWKGRVYAPANKNGGVPSAGT